MTHTQLYNFYTTNISPNPGIDDGSNPTQQKFNNDFNTWTSKLPGYNANGRGLDDIPGDTFTNPQYANTVNTASGKLVSAAGANPGSNTIGAGTGSVATPSTPNVANTGFSALVPDSNASAAAAPATTVAPQADYTPATVQGTGGNYSQNQTGAQTGAFTTNNQQNTAQNQVSGQATNTLENQTSFGTTAQNQTGTTQQSTTGGQSQNTAQNQTGTTAEQTNQQGATSQQGRTAEQGVTSQQGTTAQQGQTTDVGTSSQQGTSTQQGTNTQQTAGQSVENINQNKTGTNTTSSSGTQSAIDSLGFGALLKDQQAGAQAADNTRSTYLSDLVNTGGQAYGSQMDQAIRNSLTGSQMTGAGESARARASGYAAAQVARQNTDQRLSAAGQLAGPTAMQTLSTAANPYIGQATQGQSTTNINENTTGTNTTSNTGTTTGSNSMTGTNSATGQTSNTGTSNVTGQNASTGATATQGQTSGSGTSSSSGSTTGQNASSTLGSMTGTSFSDLLGSNTSQSLGTTAQNAVNSTQGSQLGFQNLSGQTNESTSGIATGQSSQAAAGQIPQTQQVSSGGGCVVCTAGLELGLWKLPRVLRYVVKHKLQKAYPTYRYAARGYFFAFAPLARLSLRFPTIAKALMPFARMVVYEEARLAGWPLPFKVGPGAVHWSWHCLCWLIGLLPVEDGLVDPTITRIAKKHNVFFNISKS